jgi:replicative DNA helicase
VNLEGVVLKLLLEEESKDTALEYFLELRPSYFSNKYSPVLKAIKEFYDKYGHIPSSKDLEVFRNRDKRAIQALQSIQLINTEDIDLALAVDELANQSAQTKALTLLEKFVAKISLLDREQVLEELSNIPISLEEDITHSDIVHTAADIPIFETVEDSNKKRMYCGICDEWDYEAGGYYRQEFVLLGGYRGSGKSVFCANLVAQQHLQGNVSIYATIEMDAKETWQRIISILSEVPFSRIRKNELEYQDKVKIARTLASMFDGGDEVFDKYFSTGDTDPDVIAFQAELQTTCTEKEKGRIIILDDRDLSISSLVAKVSSYKARYGDNLTLVAVDYVNQIVLEPGQDNYDWKVQTQLGKMLKNLARKADVCLVSPYQIDNNGKARFAQGILDAADLAQIIQVIDKEQGTVALETVKARSANDNGKYGLNIDWSILKIDPRAVALDNIKHDDEKVSEI